MNLIAAVERVANTCLGVERRHAKAVARQLRTARSARRVADYELATDVPRALADSVLASATEVFALLARRHAPGHQGTE